MRWILALFIVAFSACSRSPAPPASLRLAFNMPPVTLDPRKSGDFLSSTLICLIYEGLTRCAPAGGVEPGAAEKWTISPDGRTYTFTLRRSFWTDGHPVTAFDFERSWKQIIDPSFACPSAYLLFPIKNAEKYAKKEASIDQVGIRALNASTLRIELERPTSYFLPLTAFPLFLPAPEGGADGDISNGPFKLQVYRKNSEILLIKNPAFWHAKQIFLEEIRIQVIPDESTAFEMFERGDIDWLGAPLAPLPPDSLQSLKDRLHYIPMAASTILAFNTQEFPFRNLKLRKALSLCIDRDQMISEILLAGQIPARRALPPSLFGEPLKPLFGEANREEARRLLNEALAEMEITSSDLEAVILYFKSTQVDKRLAQTLKEIWREALGFTIQIEQLDPKTHMERLHQRSFQIALGAWISQFHDPVNILERYRLPSNQKNYAGWENGEFTHLLEEAALTADPKERMGFLIQAEEIFANEIPVFPLYHWTSPSLASPRLKQICTTPSGGILFERFAIDCQTGSSSEDIHK